MARSRTNGKIKKNIGGIVKLKIVVERIQKSLLMGKKGDSGTDDCFEEVPDDVKEGHFAVITAEDEEFKRFVLPLSYLEHPSFLRLLEQAAEEYGFEHEGALMVPCRSNDLERILAEGSRGNRRNMGIKSC